MNLAGSDDDEGDYDPWAGHRWREPEDVENAQAILEERITELPIWRQKACDAALAVVRGRQKKFDGDTRCFRSGQTSRSRGATYYRRREFLEAVRQARSAGSTLPGLAIFFVIDGIVEDEYDDDEDFDYDDFWHNYLDVPRWAASPCEEAVSHVLRGYYPDTYIIGQDYFSVDQRKSDSFESDRPFVKLYIMESIRDVESKLAACEWYRENYPKSRPLCEDTMMPNKRGNADFIVKSTPLEYLETLYIWCCLNHNTEMVQNWFMNFAMSQRLNDLFVILEKCDEEWLARLSMRHCLTLPNPELAYRSAWESGRRSFANAIRDLAPFFAGPCSFSKYLQH